MTKQHWLRAFLTELWNDERGEVEVETGEEQDEASPDDETTDDEDDKDKQETVSKAEFDRRVAELERVAQERLELAEHWANAAKTKPTEKPEPKPEPTEEDTTAFIEDINNRGPAAIRDFLKSEGLVRKEDVDQLVDAKAHALFENDKLQREYPQLNDQSSPFFKETAKAYAKMEGTGIPTAQRTRLAAREAELELRRTGQWESDSDESERDEAIQRQNGSTGKRKSGGGGKVIELTKAERAIAQSMGVDPKSALARKKEMEGNRRTAV